MLLSLLRITPLMFSKTNCIINFRMILWLMDIQGKIFKICFSDMIFLSVFFSYFFYIKGPSLRIGVVFLQILTRPSHGKMAKLIFLRGTNIGDSLTKIKILDIPNRLGKVCICFKIFEFFPKLPI